MRLQGEMDIILKGGARLGSRLRRRFAGWGVTVALALALVVAVGLAVTTGDPALAFAVPGVGLAGFLAWLWQRRKAQDAKVAALLEEEMATQRRRLEGAAGEAPLGDTRF